MTLGLGRANEAATERTSQVAAAAEAEKRTSGGQSMD
jgi:hypothetical protein